MKTLWLKFPDHPDAISLPYTPGMQETYPTFEAFCANFRTGWGEPGDENPRWSVTNSEDIEPMAHEWKMQP